MEESPTSKINLITIDVELKTVQWFIVVHWHHSSEYETSIHSQLLLTKTITTIHINQPPYVLLLENVVSEAKLPTRMIKLITKEIIRFLT